MDINAFVQAMENVNQAELERRKNPPVSSVWEAPHLSKQLLYFDAASQETIKNSNTFSSVWEELKTLDDNWNGHGASSLDNEIISKAIKLIDLMPSQFTKYLRNDSIVPNPTGTISLEWEKENDIISIEIGKEYSNYFTFLDGEYSKGEKIINIEEKFPKDFLNYFNRFICIIQG